MHAARDWHAVDAELLETLERARRGDRDAAHALLVRVSPRVQRTVRRLIRDDETGDYCQQALLTMLECLPKYRAEGRFESWVDAITTRVTLRAVVKRRLDQQRLRAQLVPLEPSVPATPPQRALIHGRALDAVSRLALPHQNALAVHHVLGMTVPEISAELEVPAETIRSRLRAGMGQVRADMGLFGN
jgi:RNA polymerase sigma-70 factor, ECF subfamily